MANNIKDLDTDIFRIYQIMHLSEALRQQLNFVNKNTIDKDVYAKCKEMSNLSHTLGLTVKRKLTHKGLKFQDIFPDITNEKIFVLLTIVEKFALLSEQDALEFEKHLEIELKD